MVMTALAMQVEITHSGMSKMLHNFSSLVAQQLPVLPEQLRGTGSKTSVVSASGQQHTVHAQMANRQTPV